MVHCPVLFRIFILLYCIKSKILIYKMQQQNPNHQASNPHEANSKQQNTQIPSSQELEKTAQQWKIIGNQLFKTGNYSKAIQSYSQAIKLNPKQPNYYNNRAACNITLKQYDKVIEDCNKALSIDINSMKAYRRKGLAYMNIMKFDQSLDNFQKCIKLEEDSVTQRDYEQCQQLKKNYLKVKTCLKNYDYDEGLKAVNYMLNKIEGYELLAIKVEFLTKTSQIDDAILILKKINSSISPSQSYYLRGLIELYSGDFYRSTKILNEGLRKDRSNQNNQKIQKLLQLINKSQQYRTKADQLLQQGKYDESIKQYTNAIEINLANKKMSAILFSNRAYIYMIQKNWNSALDDLNKSIDLDPYYLKSYSRRVEVQTVRNQFADVISDYNIMQVIDPSTNYKLKIKQIQRMQEQNHTKDYYSILGITKNASEQQIKNAYRILVVECHPDRIKQRSDPQKIKKETAFKQIAQAFRVLSSKEKRRLYDLGQAISQIDLNQQCDCVDVEYAFSVMQKKMESFQKGQDQSFPQYFRQRGGKGGQLFTFRFG